MFVIPLFTVTRSAADGFIFPALGFALLASSKKSTNLP